jgi:hypothetical protein
VRPVVTQNTDRWGNVVAITDPRSSAWTTTYRYNAVTFRHIGASSFPPQ